MPLEAPKGQKVGVRAGASLCDDPTRSYEAEGAAERAAFPYAEGKGNRNMGRHQEIGRQIGEVVDVKNAAYGSSFDDCGTFIRLLYPNGIPPEAYDDVLTLSRMFDKMKRIATAQGKVDPMGEDPYSDLAGYAILAVRRRSDLRNEEERKQEQKERDLENDLRNLDRLEGFDTFCKVAKGLAVDPNLLLQEMQRSAAQAERLRLTPRDISPLIRFRPEIERQSALLTKEYCDRVIAAVDLNKTLFDLREQIEAYEKDNPAATQAAIDRAMALFLESPEEKAKKSDEELSQLQATVSQYQYLRHNAEALSAEGYAIPSEAELISACSALEERLRGKAQNMGEEAFDRALRALIGDLRFERLRQAAAGVVPDADSEAVEPPQAQAAPKPSADAQEAIAEARRNAGKSDVEIAREEEAERMKQVLNLSFTAKARDRELEAAAEAMHKGRNAALDALIEEEKAQIRRFALAAEAERLRKRNEEIGEALAQERSKERRSTDDNDLRGLAEREAQPSGWLPPWSKGNNS
jgi:hypothetical protein